MKIACWNVNSIRSRMEQLTAWLARAAPDVVCFQETKVEDHIFPHDALGEVGYRAAIFGQKTYNGVAIAARFGLSIEDVKKGFDGDEPDAHRRAIAATVEGVRVVCVYVPNGQSVGAPAFTFKLGWLDRLRGELAAHYSPDQQIVVCGDFNVAPEPIDVHDPKKWEGQVLCHPDERAAVKRLLEWGLVDVVREKRPGEVGLYSWWDYRMGAYRRNAGLRIDLALCTRSLADRVTDVTIDRRPRELEKPSDHAPVILEIS
jgi:exodeoxyribonuclease III